MLRPLRRPGNRRASRREGERNDGLLGDELFPAETGARHRLLGGYSYLRTVLFTLGFVCVIGLFWQVIK
jgi:hypothetical protein